MTDKELRHLKRSDLIEILYYMRQEIEELREENAKLEKRLDILIGEAVGKKEENKKSHKGTESEKKVSVSKKK